MTVIPTCLRPTLALATALGTAGLVAVLGSPADAASGSGCRVSDYNPQWVVTSYRKKAVITTATQYGLPAHSSVHREKTSEHTTTYRASGKLNVGGSISSSGLGRLLAKVDAHFDITVAAAGSTTRSSTQKVRVDVNNPANKNTAYVAYSGYQLFYGTFKKSYCASKGGVAGTVAWHAGTYQSFAGRGSGGVTCRLAPATKLQAAAQRYC
jgi:hypothetical protein